MHLNIEAISGILGAISVACWVVVFTPQIIENFRRSSADGLSIVFIVIWLLGDVFNILGAVLQGVLPTMIILAIYYTFADIVLLVQCFYYRGFTLKDTVSELDHDTTGPATETSPLLSNHEALRQPSSETTHRALSPFRERPTSVDTTHLSSTTPVHDAERDKDALKVQSPVQKRSLIKTIMFNTTAILAVFAAGTLGWYLSTRSSLYYDARSEAHGHNKEKMQHHKHNNVPEFNVLGQIFGYICTALYLGSRVPQLLLNYRRQSTEGISMLFFMFACLGNLTYVLSIMFYEPICHNPGHCKEGEFAFIYGRNALVNLPWLAGSIGNLLQDGAIFVQYFIYRSPTLA